MCAADKQTIRKRLSLLKDLDRRDQISRTKRRSLQARRSCGLSIISRPSSSTFDYESSTSLAMGDSTLDAGKGIEPDGGRRGHVSGENSSARKVEPVRTVSWANSVFGFPMSMIAEDYYMPGTDNQSVVSTKSKRVSQILQRASFSSSQRLLVKQLLKMRYSYSSRATSRLSSAFTSSEGSIESIELPSLSKPSHRPPPLISLTPETIVERHRDKIHRANFDLTEACCYPNPKCIHIHIHNAILGTSTELHGLLSSIPAFDGDEGGTISSEDDPVFRSINEVDSNGNNALFFAARSAAPPEVLLPILRLTVDINAVNNDGQTFLFLLDPEGFHNRPCICTSGAWGGLFHIHTQSMGCLMSFLERRSFNFEHLDHDRRSFLSFLCASPSFDDEWFHAQLQRTPSWTKTMVGLSRCFDSSDRSYVHYVADETKRTRMVSPLFQWSDIPASDATQEYDRYGRPRLIQVLESAYSPKDDESQVLHQVKGLVSEGANVNGRSRDGSTALIVAAKRSCPEVVAYLLEMDAQVDHRDDAGFTAMDYAAEGFNRSRKTKVTADVTARSFKSATRLLEYAKLGRSKSKSSDSVSLRSLASVTILEQYGAEGYPFGESSVL
ncbi:hypothetical protein FB567DRAFT_254686 [Paraphoma chrysanthemicola]|uniref:Ankyrin n=1 Tax=Paraphoma chrysanthemicola TaxID=798071 RepID=A0A8K0QSZ7_9PLEO|nr:hypothetical protein FB567DRAFT_254686 [Paraphoma chrysanthemicola]